MKAASKNANDKSAKKNDAKLSINGTFAEVMKVFVNYAPPKKDTKKKNEKKKG